MRVLAAACAMLLAGTAAGAQAPVQTPVQTGPTAADRTRSAIIERVGRSVVHVKGVRKLTATPPPVPGRNGKRQKETEELFRKLMAPDKPLREEGSGFVWDAARGLIVTAAHIVERSDTVTVALPDGRELPAETVGVDTVRGIAVLRVAGTMLPELSFTTRKPRAGEATLVVGWMIPLGSVMATDGMVMGEVRSAPTAKVDAFADEPNPTEAQRLTGALALSNMLPLGSFGGGPAVDADGRVVGLVTAIFGRGGFGGNAITLAIPAAVIDEAVRQITGSRADPVSKQPTPPR